MLVTLLLGWILAQVTDTPIKQTLKYVALFDAHFKPFQRGLLRLSDVVFFLSVTWLSLSAATKALSRERWRG